MSTNRSQPGGLRYLVRYLVRLMPANQSTRVNPKRNTNDLTGCHDYLECRWPSWCRYHPAPPPRQHPAIHLAPSRPFVSFSLAPTVAITLEAAHCLRARNHYATPVIPPADGWATPTESLRHYGSYVGVHDCSLLLANFIYELDRMTIRTHRG
jgi:hypothetical protein